MGTVRTGNLSLAAGNQLVRKRLGKEDRAGGPKAVRSRTMADVRAHLTAH